MIRRSSLLAVALVTLTAPAAAAQSTLPPVGAEKPFKPAPRAERTLPNGLQVIALRHATVPKVTAILGIQSGLAVDPAEKAGLAQFVVDLAQEGTATRTSEQIKREVFG
ncbi:MAG TPA: hypothetical protein VF239_15855, partial [Vicinamibacterales bacterium]